MVAGAMSSSPVSSRVMRQRVEAMVRPLDERDVRAHLRAEGGGRDHRRGCHGSCEHERLDSAETTHIPCLGA
jgi:hypothetical protein